jgi:ABC-type bacteriocin/lantibiotic exporter with double-glycine peptidase domain
MHRLTCTRRRYLVPEIVQTSAMDCGPASLKSVLEGFRIPVNYDALRDACQTSIDGASIDTIEQLANQLDLAAEQAMLPPEYILLPEAKALPAIAVIRNPEGLTHFLVAWRYDRGLVQVMDPAFGRRWMTAESFRKSLYIHKLLVPAAEWREWAGSAEALRCLLRTLTDAGVRRETAERLTAIAAGDQSWRGLAGLSAAARLIQSLIRSPAGIGAIPTTRLLEELFDTARNGGCETIVPQLYWPVVSTGLNGAEQEQLLLTGAVLVRIHGRGYNTETAQVTPDSAIPDETLTSATITELKRPVPGPKRELLRLIRSDGLLAPAVLAKSIIASAGIVVGEALLFRSLLDIGAQLNLQGQRFVAIGLLTFILAIALLLNLPIASEVLRLGRHLECRLRLALFEKLARLDDRYFRSRLISDLAERGHSIHALRRLPAIGSQLLASSFQLIFTTAGIIWLAPASVLLTVITAAVSVVLPIIAQPALAERGLCMRNHVAALGRFYLDAMLGLIPVRAHAAERAVRSAHERLTAEWARAGLSLQRLCVLVDVFQFAAGFGLAIWLLATGIARPEGSGSLLLLMFWVLSLAPIGQSIGIAVRQYPAYRNVMLRLLEPLAASGHDISSPVGLHDGAKYDCRDRALNRGIEAIFDRVTLNVSGSTILEEISLQLQSGSHVVLVGRSGAGKSSLVGLLLGWNAPSAGQILVDCEPLEGARLARLREETAWVDPAVQLWNRSLADNLCYGALAASAERLGQVVRAVELRELLESLPSGLQTQLGENGALVSGGEGQRVRLGRALMRGDSRLVILDEPFTALDRAHRRHLLLRARKLWQGATLIYITHDISEIFEFERVLVMYSGKIVEDGSPRRLIENPESHLRAMQQDDAVARGHFLSSESWRHLELEAGELTETKPQLADVRRGKILASAEADRLRSRSPN